MVVVARCLVVLIAISGVSLFASDNEGEVTALELATTQQPRVERKSRIKEDPKSKGKKASKGSQMKPSHRVDNNLKDLEQGMSDGDVLLWTEFMKHRRVDQRRLINDIVGDGMPPHTMTRGRGLHGADSVEGEEGENVPLLEGADRERQQQALMLLIDGLEREHKQREEHLQQSAALARELNENTLRTSRCAIITSSIISTVASALSTSTVWAIYLLSQHKKSA